MYGERARVLRGAEGRVCWPELARGVVGVAVVQREIGMDWRRARGRKQRGTREESLAFKRVWSGGVNRTALKRIDEAINRQ